MKISRAMTMAAGLFLTAVPARAQTPEQDVLAVVTRFFDGMRTRDTAMIAGTLFGDIKLVTTANNREGRPVARADAISGFLRAISKATGKLDERIIEPEVRVEDNLATVWTRYEFYLNDQYSHCGIDAFHLVRTEAGWKIATIADTRKANCK